MNAYSFPVDRTFTHEGHRFRVVHVLDDSGALPWKKEGGHGPVEDMPRRAYQTGYAYKRAGQRELGEHWLYDFAEACRIARRDGWGFLPHPLKTSPCEGGYRAEAGPFHATASDVNEAIRAVYAAHRATFPTARAYAAAAAEYDYRWMQAFANDQWQYVGVVVTLLDDSGDATDESASLLAVESDAGDYLDVVARELAEEITARIRAAMGE